MIYTVTLNPSLDYVVSVRDFTLGKVNRSCHEELFPGGKGLNVARMLTNLGVESEAWGFAAGFTGEEIKRKMEEKGCRCQLIEAAAGHSRINVKIRSQKETELNASGPLISQENMEELIRGMDKLKAGDYLVLAGSVPSCLPENTYQRLGRKAKARGAKIVADAEGRYLLPLLEEGVFLVKPNHVELGEIFQCSLHTEEEIKRCGRELCRMGAEWALVSMAGEGAMLFGGGLSLYQPAPKGKAVNSVGAGDSMVAGFLAEYQRSGDVKKALRFGVAAGSATAFCQDLADGERVKALADGLPEPAGI